MKTLRKHTLFLFLLAVLACAVLAIMPGQKAEADVTIKEPRPDSQLTYGAYVAWGAGGVEIQVNVQTATLWSYQYDHGPHHVWFRLLRNGQTFDFFEADVDKSVTCKFNYLFKDYGVFTMEVQVDKPDYNAGNLTYHVFGEADFAPDASVTFTVKHDHEFRFSDPTWEENYTVDQEPTCTKAGAESIHCSVCGESKPDSVREIPALGHNWKKITYTWSQDYKKVTASAVCKNNADHTLSETAKTKAVTTPATIKKEGKTVYTATFKKEAFSEQKKTVKLPKLVAVKTVKLNKTKATLAVGKKLQLKVKAITPKNAAIKTVKWTSSNKKVATVDKNGKVTARSAGTCKITCTATDGSKKKATVTITVE